MAHLEASADPLGSRPEPLSAVTVRERADQDPGLRELPTTKRRSATPVLDAGPATAVVPSARRSPATRGCGGPPQRADDGLGQQLHLANWMINRVFQISLELHAAATKDEHTCEFFDGVVEHLDRLIVDVRLETFAAPQPSERQAADPSTEITRATKALDAALHHLDDAWTTAVTSGDQHALGDRLSHAAHLTQSATRVLSSEVLY